MENSKTSVGEKVKAIFHEFAGNRVTNLDPTIFPAGIASIIRSAIVSQDASEEEILRADEIAFHLTDWSSEAAFLVALHLFPERFNPEDIREGVEGLLLHAPQHIIAAARLARYPTEDIF